MKKSFNKLTALVITAGAVLSQLSLSVFAEGESAAADGSGTSGEAATASGGLNPILVMLIWIVIFGLIAYFLIIRPGKKRQKEEEQLKASLVLGDEITTIGGICGKIVNIKDDVITIESSIDRTLIEFKNWAIKEVKKPISDK